ncbi:hypothetical protein F4802DRAFT_72223 [Xylaria palmicola]|nr:hypothetical protein F4802DRAFT_72223 [Xylaria palmicola]
MADPGVIAAMQQADNQANLLVLLRDNKMKRLAADREKQVEASMKDLHEIWARECSLVQECNVLRHELDVHWTAYFQELEALRERYRVSEEPAVHRITRFTQEITYLANRRGIVARDIQRVNDLHAMKTVEVNREFRRGMEQHHTLSSDRRPQANDQSTQYQETPRRLKRNRTSMDMNSLKNGRRRSSM